MSHRGDNPFPSTERSECELNQRSSTGRPVREVQNQGTEVKLAHHNLQVSDTRYIEKVFAKVRQNFESSRRRPDAGSKDQCIDMKQQYISENETFVACRSANFDAPKMFFDSTQKLILNPKHEILSDSTIEWYDKALKWAKSEGTRLLRLSCLGRMHGKISFKSPRCTENDLESMENQLSSSGIFFHDIQHCRFSKRFQK